MDDNIMWEPKEEYDARMKFLEKLREDYMKMIWGTYVPSPPRPWDNVKIAWVKINGNRKMLGVDNKTMKGYAMEATIPTFKIPLEEQKYDTFERWCTSFDL